MIKWGITSGPITSWEIDVETVSDFIFLGSKITADGDCSHEIKRCLLFGRKNMTNLDNILKSKDISLLVNIHIVKAVFLLGFILYGTLGFLDLIDYFFFHVGEIFNYNLFKNFLISFLFLLGAL